ncbi:lipocalin-like domain-containing protein [Fischerella sp. JS2]|uniref:lipocalin-like domain-containing protein n=1 Tax=Fischerella sp. JS2 TaxID=2597771 RepID=UPI0028E5E91A|nr:lipocalin-like domain-containing protein [Fischerella sp. JS2]
MSSLSSVEHNPLLGTWKLISATAINPDGTIDSEVYGSHPTGYITYTPERRMMVIFSQRDRLALTGDIRSPFSKEIKSLPPQECLQAFSTFNAYAGMYTIEGNTVTHHVEIASIPNRVGTDLVRTFTLNGNQVTLQTPPTKTAGVEKVFELVWEKVES